MHEPESELLALIERTRLAAVAAEQKAARQRTLRLADELPEGEGALVLELVDTLDAVLVENHEPAADEIVIDLRGRR